MTKVISFVSFKGGAGRSVGLSNIAFQLSKKYKVGCIDFDIEAGGLHKIFEIVGTSKKQSIHHFLIDNEDYFDAVGIEKPNYSSDNIFKDNLVIDLFESSSCIPSTNNFKGNLYLIQAKPNASLTSYIDTGVNLFHNFNELIERFSNVLNLDYVFVDCRSGISNLGLPGISYCNLAMIFFKWSKQHRYGTLEFLRWYHDWIEKGNMEIKISIVASSIKKNTITNDDVIDYLSENGAENIPCDISTIGEIAELISDDKIIDGDISLGYNKLSELIIRQTSSSLANS